MLNVSSNYLKYKNIAYTQFDNSTLTGTPLATPQSPLIYPWDRICLSYSGLSGHLITFPIGAMVKKAKIPSFIHELALLVNKTNEKTLLPRLEMARQPNNVSLGESL
jgi:hypothetical protein